MIRRLPPRRLASSRPRRSRFSGAMSVAKNARSQMLFATLDASFDAILLLDQSGKRILYANSPAREFLIGSSQADWTQVTPRDLGLQEIVVAARERIAVRDSSTFTLSCSLRRNDQTRVPTTCRVVPSTTNSAMMVLFQPNPTARWLPSVTRDPLTGLLDRRVFEQRLARILDRNRTELSPSFAMFFVDLNGFKAINDLRGHLVGDQVLRETAQRLRHSFRPNDTVARFGGDEFIVLLETVHSAYDATNAAERLLKRIAMPIQVDGQVFTVSASVGIVLDGPNCRCGLALLEAADRAMYQAKSQGPGRYVVFDEQECPPFPNQASEKASSRDGSDQAIRQPSE